MRSALGAGRAGIVRYLLAEGTVLAAASGLLAVSMAWWGIPALASLAPDSLPRIHRVRLDGTGALYALGMSGGVALFLALLPIVRLRGTLAGGPPDGGRTASAGRDRQLLRSTLVVGQVALALTLMVAAGLLLRSLRQLRTVDPGIEPEGVVTASLYPGGERYSTAAGRWRFFQELLGRVRSLPGVYAAGLGNQRPVDDSYACTVQGFGDPRVYDRLSADDLTTCAGVAVVTPGYFEALGIPVLRGRSFTDADLDDPDRRTVVVSRAFADRFWPGEDPLGKRVAPNGWRDPLWTVVGVVGDVKASSLDGLDAIAIYYPAVGPPGIERWWTPYMLFVRTTGRGGTSPATLVGDVEAILKELDPSIPLADVETMEGVVARSSSRMSFTSLLLQIAAAAALLLAAVGLYGVVAYVVTRRTREIGMRIAIGAEPAAVVAMVVRQAFVLALLGVVLGGALALVSSRLLEGFLRDRRRRSVNRDGLGAVASGGGDRGGPAPCGPGRPGGPGPGATGGMIGPSPGRPPPPSRRLCSSPPCPTGWKPSTSMTVSTLPPTPDA